MKKTVLRIFAALVFIALIAVYFIYQKYQSGGAVPQNLSEDARFVQIPTNSSYEEVVAILEDKGIIQDKMVFDQLAEYMEYKKNPMRAGRFEIEPGMSTVDLIRHLRNGAQAPVNVILTNERLLEDVAGKVARFIEPDSLDLIMLFHNDKYLADLGYNRDNLMSLFIPNTYELYWNSSPEDFINRMTKEHERFWKTNNRSKKAQKIDLSKKEVYTLASIVEKETLRKDEKKRMAGVYYNRLEKGMLLQADPTAVFATRDFGTPRVLNRHINFDSPFNTYKYPGLPPGPIAMASIGSIDAVLNVEDHDYLFFCAKGDGSGYHAFAKTLSGHNANAARYRKNLKKRGLR